MLNVKDFGAKGDSVTDDTVAIQAAMDAGFLQAIYFPQGVYKISSTINSPTQARIYGDVRGGSVIDVTANISHLKTKDCFDLYVEQLKFRDPSSLQSNCGAIHIDNLTGGDHQRLYLTDIAIEGCYFGIFNSPLGTRNTFGHVYRSLVMSCRGAGMHLHKTTGFRLYDVLSDHATVPNVEQIDIWFNGVSGFGGGAVLINVVSASAMHDGIVFTKYLQVWGHHVSGDVAGGVGITIDHSEEIYITGLFGSVAHADGLLIKNNSRKVSLTSPQFAVSRTQSGFSALNSSDIEITGGRSINNHFAGLVFDGCTNFRVQGHRCSGNGTEGIYIKNGCDKYIVTGNDFTGNVGTNWRDEATGTPTKAVANNLI